MKSVKTTVISYIVLCLACLLGLCFFFFYSMHAIEKSIPPAILLDAGWTIHLNDTLHENVSLSSFSFPVTKKGDVLVLENTLLQIDKPRPVLRLYTWYCMVDVFLNGEQVYTYGHDIHARKKNVGCGSHVIPITTPATTVKVVLTVTEPNSFSSLQPIYVESAENSFVALFTSRSFAFASSIFFIILGILGILTAIILKFAVHTAYSPARLVAVSQTAFWLGLCSLCNNGCVGVFFSNYTFNSWLEHVAIYGVNLSMLAVFYTSMTYNTIQKRIIAFFIAVFSVYCLTAIILNAYNVMHLPASRMILMGLMSIEVVVSIAISIKNCMTQSIKNVLPSLCFIFMMFLAGIDIVRYGVFKYTLFQATFMRGSLLSLGALVFLAGMLINFFLHLSAITSDRANSIQLEQHRRTDYLTGFANSVKIMEVLSAEEAKKTEYAIIIIHLEPATCDSSHVNMLEVDEFLCIFAEHLNKLFSAHGTIARIEDGIFCVAVTDITQNQINKQLFTLKDLLFAEMQKCPRMQYYMTSGYAFRSETSDLNQLYQTAEDRSQRQVIAARKEHHT